MVKELFKRSATYNFNQVERDTWVKQQAGTVLGGSLVLDLGAGSCPYRQYFVHCRYETQDFVTLGAHALRGGRGYGAIDYICDATAIPVPDGRFDVVLCTEVLEHVAEPIEVVREIARILKPGGRLILTAPLGSGLHQEPFHFYGGYTPWWYDRFLSECGFEDIVVLPNGGFFRHYGQESIRFARLLRHAFGRHYPWATPIFLPFWALIIVPLFAGLFPLICRYIDTLDDEKKFSVGYHVSAKRCSKA